jgi:hypothetical protein
MRFFKRFRVVLGTSENLEDTPVEVNKKLESPLLFCCIVVNQGRPLPRSADFSILVNRIGCGSLGVLATDRQGLEERSNVIPCPEESNTQGLGQCPSLAPAFE